MSSVNTGNQLIYWRYKQELISSDLGKMLHNIIQPGVYSGGNITLDSGDTVNIAPLDVVCYTSANQWVHVKTQDTVSLELSETDCYVTCQFTWVDSSSNYMDFTAKASGDILTTDVIIGKAIYEVGAITGFDYSEKTWGILRGEGIREGGAKVETVLTADSDDKIPTSKAVADHVIDYVATKKYTDTDYTILDDDGYRRIEVDTTTSAVTITLPLMANNTGRRIEIALVGNDVSLYPVTITPDATDANKLSNSGLASMTLLEPGQSVILQQSDNSDRWEVVSQGVATYGGAPIYACRAWVNFNGTGTVAIRASGNVSSITDNGTGNYTVNFITAMPDVNYSPIISFNATTLRNIYGYTNTTGTRVPINNTVSSTNLSFRDTTDVATDLEYINMAIFR
jgi:hypothetical protein